MLKIITLITNFILIALTALLFGSCNFSINKNAITGSGTISTEKRTVENDFKSIEVSNAIDVVVEQSDKIEIIVEADDNLINSITTKVENGVLIIACDYNSFVDIESKKVTVRMPYIEELRASSASSIKSLNILKGDEINIRASSAANVNLNLEYDHVEAKASSASAVIIDGLALDLDAEASSGSDIQARDLLTNEATTEASSGASITVNATVNLKAKASSGGSIEYDKTPKSLEKRTSSGGSVDKV